MSLSSPALEAAECEAKAAQEKLQGSRERLQKAGCVLRTTVATVAAFNEASNRSTAKRQLVFDAASAVATKTPSEQPDTFESCLRHLPAQWQPHLLAMAAPLKGQEQTSPAALSVVAAATARRV
eukprot:3269719-Prymnesium_polylepis.2